MNTNQHIKEALQEIGYEPMSYSGRGMFGKSCVAIKISGFGELFGLGSNLAIELTDALSGMADSAADMIGEMGNPSIDTFGRGYVAYWPNLKW